VVEDPTLSRLERNIHDGAQQHLVALGVSLGLGPRAVRLRSRGCPGDARRAGASGTQALAELNDLGRGIYPRSLIAGGVADALAALAADT
jgi:signal transduction histidine kinase